jgi:hypothetical protein
MSKVFVIDQKKRSLNPIHSAQARQLLRNKKAAVFRQFPFVIILKESHPNLPSSPIRLKIDPGAKHTGITLVKDASGEVVFAAELKHRGFAIRDSLRYRRQLRRSRRARITRYRKPRFLNRTRPSSDAAAVNITRFALLSVLKSTGLLVETGSGGLTKFNRSQQNLEKTHWLDAACVGKSTPVLIIKGIKPLLITANGHGSRQSCRTDKFGFPSRYVPRFKFVNGFQTGDIVKAIVAKGKNIGKYVGRVAVRTSGSFNISDASGLIQGVSHKYCKSIHKKDGYGYNA